MGHLLCVANFPTNTGYAWDFIEGLYAAVADDLAPLGIRTWVAYPRIDEPPASLAGSAARPLEMRIQLNDPLRVFGLGRELRRRRIGAIYLTDQPVWHLAYALLRAFGVRTIVVHDHTSGERVAPVGGRLALKRWSRRFGPALADRVLAVSAYVRQRKLDVDLMPVERVDVVSNSVAIPEVVDRSALRTLLGVPAERPIVACACRAAEYKGVQVLLRAFDRLVGESGLRPLLVYFGDGPHLPALMRVREGLDARADIVLAGYRPNVADLLGGADLCVVPSLWAEAFGLAALEPAALGVAVVASNVGGIPEVVVHGETGILVPPGDPRALAEALRQLLVDGERRLEMGRQGRERARRLFARERQTRALTRTFRGVLGLEGHAHPQSIAQPMIMDLP